MSTTNKGQDPFNEWLKAELTKAGLKGAVYGPFIRSVLENEEIDDDSKWCDIKAYTAEQISDTLLEEIFTRWYNADTSPKPSDEISKSPAQKIESRESASK
jgi:hypothetical protein